MRDRRKDEELVKEQGTHWAKTVCKRHVDRTG